jgi:hypothetical protein
MIWASRLLLAVVVFWAPQVELDVLYSALWQCGRYPVQIYQQTDPLCPHLYPAPRLYRDDAGVCVNAWSGSTRLLFGGSPDCGESGGRRLGAVASRAAALQQCNELGQTGYKSRGLVSTTTRRFSLPADTTFVFAFVGNWSKNSC